ncbi:galactose oxidase, partial [Lecanoromycetidae sp. Uapishka_2]
MQSRILGLLALLSASAPFASALSTSQVTNNVAAAKNVQSSSTDNGGLNTEGVATLDGMALDAIPEGRSAEAVMASAITPAAWTATADSYQPGYPPSNVLDGNVNTFWHTPFGADGNPLPHTLIINMQQPYLINSIAYIPRQDGQSNGNVGEHQIQTSLDGITYGTPVAMGTYQDSNSTKTTIFEATDAQYVKFTALTEAGDRGPWTSCSTFSIFQTTVTAPPSGEGEWSPTLDFPLVPVSMGIEHDSGNVMVWSSYAASTFGGSPGGNTLTATYNPATGIVSQRNVTNTDHDMFCEGLSIDSTGRFFATGGNSAPKTSIYSPKYDVWTTGPLMNIPRGYQSMTTLSNGDIFVIGGSWSGGTGGKNGELYSYASNTWSLLSGAPVAPMLTNDAQGVYRADNHGWLFGWKDGYVFQAGPSKAMNWYGTAGAGSVESAGTRGNDGDAMCGNAVMYDATAGKILTVGGAVDYQGINSTANAHIITLNGPNSIVAVENINPMWFQRIFANAVVLPNGHVFITGGQIYGQPFSDDTSQLTPEMWDPVSTTFTKLSPQAIPRNYHSTALLMPDATILSAGGGLCGACATNHYDGQVYSPAYLFNADGSRATRPVITTAPDTASISGTLTATTDSPVTAWAMIRLGSTTHTVNTDQRRIPLYATNNGNTYTMPLPTDPGIMIPGYYYLFASNAAGVPSIAKFVWVPIP